MYIQTTSMLQRTDKKFSEKSQWVSFVDELGIINSLVAWCANHLCIFRKRIRKYPSAVKVECLFINMRYLLKSYSDSSYISERIESLLVDSVGGPSLSFDRTDWLTDWTDWMDQRFTKLSYCSGARGTWVPCLRTCRFLRSFMFINSQISSINWLNWMNEHCTELERWSGAQVPCLRACRFLRSPLPIHSRTNRTFGQHDAQSPKQSSGEGLTITLAFNIIVRWWW